MWSATIEEQTKCYRSTEESTHVFSSQSKRWEVSGWVLYMYYISNQFWNPDEHSL